MKLKFPPCGALCEICKDYLKGKCEGCIQSQGKIWFLKFTKFKVCPIFDCTIKKKVKMCIECERFPCKEFLEWYNPKIGFFKSSLARVGSLFLRKKFGDKKWRKILKQYEGKIRK